MTPERLKEIEDHAMRADLVPSAVALELIVAVCDGEAAIDTLVEAARVRSEVRQPLFSALKAWHLADRLVRDQDLGWADLQSKCDEVLVTYRAYKKGGN